jgi:hypothetical protein
MRTITMIVTVVVLSLLAFPVQARHLHPESWYQARWCEAQGGEMEHRLPDRARVDCLLPDVAVEFDFGHKWAESVGQALYYATMTGRRCGIVLILEDNGPVFVTRLMRTIEGHRLGCQVWLMGREGEELGTGETTRGEERP